MSSDEVRNLQAELDKTHQKIDALEQGIQAQREELRSYQTRRRTLERRIKAALEANPRVTDHAVVRYLERELGVDTDAIRAEILTEKVADTIVWMGSGSGKIRRGQSNLIIKDGAVISVVPAS